jgi:hypothetical protein
MPVSDELKAKISEALRDALVNEIRQVSADVFDEYVNEYLNDCDCWLRFEDGEPIIEIGIGPTSSASGSFTPEIYVEDYARCGGPCSEEQLHDVLQQIDGMKLFAATLVETMAGLQKKADEYQAMTSSTRLRVVATDSTPSPTPHPEADEPPHDQSQTGQRAADE